MARRIAVTVAGRSSSRYRAPCLPITYEHVSSHSDEAERSIRDDSESADEQRRLLQVVVEKAAWQHGALQTTLFESFEILRHSNRESSRREKEKAGSGRELGIWLPGMDSNRGSRLRWLSLKDALYGHR